jgi:hypothetical protein
VLRHRQGFAAWAGWAAESQDRWRPAF